MKPGDSIRTLVQVYVAEREAALPSPASARTYRFAMDRVVQWAEETGVTPRTFQRSHVTEFTT